MAKKISDGPPDGNQPGRMSSGAIQSMTKSILSDHDADDSEVGELGEHGQHGIPIPEGQQIDSMHFDKADNGGAVARTNFKPKPGFKPKDGEPGHAFHSHTAVVANHAEASEHLKNLFRK